MAATVAVLWGGSILVVGLANAIWPTYGQAVLQLSASVYPGYAGTPGVGQTIIGALYGILDGAIAGAIFAWLYNLVGARLNAAGAP
jgi:hypothetical protein